MSIFCGDSFSNLMGLRATNKSTGTTRDVSTEAKNVKKCAVLKAANSRRLILEHEL